MMQKFQETGLAGAFFKRTVNLNKPISNTFKECSTQENT